MLNTIYRWRQRREMNRNAYKLPADAGRHSFHFHFGSYLGQNSVKGRDFARFDLPRRRRRRRHIVYRLLAVGILVYILIESLRALSLLRI
jgi:hypothetical protein